MVSNPSIPPAYAWRLNGNVNETISGLAPYATLPAPPVYAAARYGQLGLSQTCMRYTGTTPPLPLLPLSGGVTIALWLYYTNSASGTVFSISGFAATSYTTTSGKITCSIINPPSPGLCFTFNSSAGGGGALNQVFPTYNINSWNHYVISFIKSGSVVFYLNGVQFGTPATVPTAWDGPTDTTSSRFGGNVGLGCAEGTSVTPTGMTFSDWRFYNTVLTPAQVQSVYQSGGYYLAPQMSMTGAPLLKLLSAQAQTSATGIFSLRAVSGVTVKVVNVVRSSDSATQDFYADRLGNLLTAPVTGQSLSTWLGGVTGRVATWYDQSGAGNHATQTTPANQPQINLTTSPYSVTGPGWVTVPAFSFNFGTSAGYSLRMVVGNTTGGCVVYKGTTAFGWTTDYKHWSFGPGGASTSETANGLFPYAVGYSEKWTYSGTAITTAKTSVTYVATGTTQNATTMYINASQVALNGNYTTQTLAPDPDAAVAFAIGNGGVTGGTAPFSGNIYEVIVFSKPLSASDVTFLG